MAIHHRLTALARRLLSLLRRARDERPRIGSAKPRETYQLANSTAQSVAVRLNDNPTFPVPLLPEPARQELKDFEVELRLAEPVRRQADRLLGIAERGIDVAALIIDQSERQTAWLVSAQSIPARSD